MRIDATRRVATGFGLFLAIFAHVFPQERLTFAHTQATLRANTRKLPSPEKIVGDYLKMTGGKKRQAAIRDAIYEWTVKGENDVESRARVLTKAPLALYSEMETGAVTVITAANARTAWWRSADSTVMTLTGDEAYNAKLRAALGASRLIDFKKLKVLARTAALDTIGAEPAYAIEFSTKEGGKARFWFGTASKLLLKTSERNGGVYLYGDYRSVNGILEPHRVVHESNGKTIATFVLRSVRYNTGLADSTFDPPGDSTLDIAALLRDLGRNQAEVDRRVNEYTFTRKVSERELTDRGEVKKEKTRVYEVYPIAGWGMVEKLVSEDGVPLSPERAAREEKRVAEQLVKGEREAPKREEERQRKRAERTSKMKAKGDSEESDGANDVGVATFLRACDFVSPRRERFRERETIVFDFRPRVGFRPRTRGETLVSKLSGTIWIDPAERHVMRIEARLVESFKMGGGLLASIKPGSALVFEQTRLDDGVWLPRFSQVNASARVLLFSGMNINETNEFSDYKRFSTKAGEDKLDSPKKP